LFQFRLDGTRQAPAQSGPRKRLLVVAYYRHVRNAMLWLSRTAVIRILKTRRHAPGEDWHWSELVLEEMRPPQMFQTPDEPIKPQRPY
jgi:hypothetical protein